MAQKDNECRQLRAQIQTLQGHLKRAERKDRESSKKIKEKDEEIEKLRGAQIITDRMRRAMHTLTEEFSKAPQRTEEVASNVAQGAPTSFYEWRTINPYTPYMFPPVAHQYTAPQPVATAPLPPALADEDDLEQLLVSSDRRVDCSGPRPVIQLDV